MNENINSFILNLRNAIGDHNYNDSAGYQMVRIKQEDSEGDVSQTNKNMTRLNNTVENDKDSTISRSAASWTGSKSSVAIIYPCYLCNYETFRSTALVAHLRQHRQGNLTLETERFQIGKFMCSVCDFKTRWLSSLKEHEEKAHFSNNNDSASAVNNSRTNGEAHICRICGYSTEKLETLGNHMRRHFIHNYPCCCLCKFTSKHWDELKNHFNVVHCRGSLSDARGNGSDSVNVAHDQKSLEDETPEYPCDYCTHRSSTIHLWRDHMESHGGVLEISLGSVHH